MNIRILLLCSLFISGIASAQNSDPWPTTGKVGIGTTTPAASLHIKDATAGVPLLRLSDNTYSTDFSQNAYTTTINASANFSLYWGSGASRNHMSLAGGSGTRFLLSSVYGALLNGYGGFKVGHLEKFGFHTDGATNSYYAMGAIFTNNGNWGLNFFTRNETADIEVARFTSVGNFGLGTTTPSAKLHVVGTVRLANLAADNSQSKILVTDANGNVFTRDVSTIGGANGWSFDGSAVGVEKKFGTSDNYALPFITNNVEHMRIDTDGNVMIGTSSARGKFAVEGTIYAMKVKVTANDWADYVFEKDYRLMPLEELEAFIEKNKHLPEVPTTKEVEANGADLGDTQVTLLKKIEELTLYVISLKKEIDQLKEKNSK